MYGKYLKDRKNPQVLNKDELRLIKYDDYNGNYSFEISGEKYDRINQAVDRVEDGMFHALMLGLRGFGNFIRTLSKYLAD